MPLTDLKAQGDFIGTDEPEPQTVAYIDDHRNRRRWTPEEKRAFAALLSAAPRMFRALTNILVTLDDYEIDADNVDDIRALLRELHAQGVKE